ncbi:LexA family transcriptional regulator [Alcaligenaceae bacterium B3P038]|nr:LexA family transcriptional regulator [Alcaligenaceae bacterium B3P038]
MQAVNLLNMSTLQDRIKEAAADAGLSQSELARRVRLTRGAVSHWFAGNTKELTGENLLAVAAALGVNPTWLGRGIGPKSSSEAAGHLPEFAPQKKWPFKTISEDSIRSLTGRDATLLEGAIALAIAQLKIGISVSEAPMTVAAPRLGTIVDTSTVEDPFPFIPSKPMPWELPPVDSPRPHREDLRINTAVNVGHITDTGYSANDQEYLPVPELSVRLAAGQLGIENYSETEIGEIMFRRSFLASLGLPIERMKIVYADGDSMAPVIRDKAPMLFYEEMISDPSQIDSRTVYAINYGGKMIVKCLVRNRFNKWMARSLNPAHKDFPLAEDDGSEVRIVGRILWSPYDLRDGVDERLVRR